MVSKPADADLSFQNHGFGLCTTEGNETAMKTFRVSLLVVIYIPVNLGPLFQSLSSAFTRSSQPILRSSPQGPIHQVNFCKRFVISFASASTHVLVRTPAGAEMHCRIVSCSPFERMRCSQHKCFACIVGCLLLVVALQTVSFYKLSRWIPNSLFEFV